MSDGAWECKCTEWITVRVIRNSVADPCLFRQAAHHPERVVRVVIPVALILWATPVRGVLIREPTFLAGLSSLTLTILLGLRFGNMGYSRDDLCDMSHRVVSQAGKEK